MMSGLTPEEEQEILDETDEIETPVSIKNMNIDNWLTKCETSYVSVKKASEDGMILQITGEDIVQQQSKFAREKKESGKTVFKKGPDGKPQLDNQNNPIAETYLPMEDYLPVRDANGKRWLLNANLGFKKAFPPFVKEFGRDAWFALSASGAGKDYKVVIEVAQEP